VTTPMASRAPLPTKFAAAEKHTARLSWEDDIHHRRTQIFLMTQSLFQLWGTCEPKGGQEVPSWPSDCRSAGRGNEHNARNRRLDLFAIVFSSVGRVADRVVCLSRRRGRHSPVARARPHITRRSSLPPPPRRLIVIDRSPLAPPQHKGLGGGCPTTDFLAMRITS
jgi:hypothetical protein